MTTKRRWDGEKPDSPPADVAGLVERLLKSDGNAYSTDAVRAEAVDALTHMAAERDEQSALRNGQKLRAEEAEQALAAANAEIERLNKGWTESRASAADAGLALRELANDLTAARAQRDLAEVKRADTERMYEGALTAARARIALLEEGLREAIDRWEANTPYVSEFPRIAKARSLLGEQADG